MNIILVHIHELGERFAEKHTCNANVSKRQLWNLNRVPDHYTLSYPLILYTYCHHRREFLLLLSQLGEISAGKRKL